ncbi:hypothetical protein N7471_013510 [Penicillium samsonianum]|uniref:uncharacterized protein n=1 Tax=Penicillium samsonianum TaxID=1882272 RepID=UPI002546A1EE|nr:uncharacterized protein N7471_013510 [Penicillium samsonianum]KAJ6118890.1 hypothetical protein N7471_013510 [Penicillium samsonianum]
MPILNYLPVDVTGATKILQAGLEGGKLAVAYGKSALEKPVNVTVQVAGWSTQNPVLAAHVWSWALVVLWFSLLPASQRPQFYRVWDSQQAESTQVYTNSQESTA